jgi:hypothetical protein
MIDTQLFLGLPLSDSYQQELSRQPASVRELFIQLHSSPYLQQLESEGILYLGKYLGSSVEFATLDVVQAHIYSILKKLIPHYSDEEQPLLLLALSSSHSFQ